MVESLDYIKWKDQNISILKNLSDKKVFITYSGGKDSSVTLYMLNEAGREFGFEFETHAAVYPHNVFNDAEKDRLDLFWKEQGIGIIWHELTDPDDLLEDALKRNIVPCQICNKVKKDRLINIVKSSFPDVSSLVIVMSYSLWDLVSSNVEHILNTIYSNPGLSTGIKGKDPDERFMETSQRFYPFIRLNKGLSIFKPLIYYNDQEIMNFISEKNIPTITEKCKYHIYRPKRLFANYYKQMDLHFDYHKVMQFAKKSLELPELSYFEGIDIKKYLSKMI
jgi:tRNA(Ile)-lysidine synthase TilS/MesJ